MDMYTGMAVTYITQAIGPHPVLVTVAIQKAIGNRVEEDMFGCRDTGDDGGSRITMYTTVVYFNGLRLMKG
jgi:hypothetical protein